MCFYAELAVEPVVRSRKYGGLVTTVSTLAAGKNYPGEDAAPDLLDIAAAVALVLLALDELERQA